MGFKVPNMILSIISADIANVTEIADIGESGNKIYQLIPIPIPRF